MIAAVSRCAPWLRRYGRALTYAGRDQLAYPAALLTRGVLHSGAILFEAIDAPIGGYTITDVMFLWAVAAAGFGIDTGQQLERDPAFLISLRTSGSGEPVERLPATVPSHYACFACDSGTREEIVPSLPESDRLFFAVTTAFDV